jgi:hypothetical protein
MRQFKVVSFGYKALKGTPEQEVKAIYRHFFDCVEADSLDYFGLTFVDMLDDLNDYNTDISVLLAPLSISVPVKNKLSGREEYYTALEQHLLQRDPARVEALLSGLK